MIFDIKGIGYNSVLYMIQAHLMNSVVQLERVMVVSGMEYNVLKSTPNSFERWK